MSNQLLLGDCLEVMRGLPANSVDAVVTDPPYGLSFMGKRWDYDVPTVAVWREVLRVLKPGGHLLSFAGTRTQHRMAVNIEDAGFEIRDMIAWVYGSGFPKSHNLEGEWEGFGTALKPALEPITLARKPLQGTIAANVQEWGTGGINVDGCRVGTDETLGRAKSGWGNAAVGATNYGNFNSVGVTKEGGRWPANLIHSGESEVVSCFPESVSRPNSCGATLEALISVPTVQNAPYNRKSGPNYQDSDTSAARFFKTCPDDDAEDAATRRIVYQAKASKSDRDEGLEGFEVGQTVGGGGGIGDYLDDVNSASGKYGSEKAPARNTHPTVKPTPLMQYLCRLITPPGGVILDPFMGSGSTGNAAMLEGFQFIGIEQDAEYLEIARARIAAAVQRSEAMTLEQRVSWLETQVQAQGAKVRKLEAQQQMTIFDALGA